MKCYEPLDEGGFLVHEIMRNLNTWCSWSVEWEHGKWPGADENEAVTCLECLAEKANAAARARAFQQKLIAQRVRP
jgi:hypothetical protein